MRSVDFRMALVILVAAGQLSWTLQLTLAAEPDPEIEILQPGVRLTLFAEHPDLVTPTGVDIDSEGNVWVVATHTHFRPEQYDGPTHDEVLVFTDSTGDGRADQRRVFYNATVATMDLTLGPDGWVYLAERSRILRIRDSTGDGKADIEESIAVLDTVADYPHNGLSGLAWHPDGDLMFGLGENYAQAWTLTGTDGVAHRGTGEGGVFRCTPDGKRLHRVARGFWNPFGIVVRDDGEIFAVDNDPGARPPCRLLHIVEGGDYGYQRLYGNEAHHPFVCWNGEMRGTLPMMHPTGEAPCGVQSLGGGLLAPTWTDHRIDFYPLRRDGASFSTERIVLAQGGNHFRPVCIAPQRRQDAAKGAGSSGEGASEKLTYFFTDWVYVSYQLHGHGRVWKLEIDPSQADWLDPASPEPPNEPAALAAILRAGGQLPRQESLLQFMAGGDPFLSQAALHALSRGASDWDPADVVNWKDADRVTAVQALKIASRLGEPGASPERWLPAFLADTDSDVRFEALRWIADAALTEYLPDVERMLQETELDYQLFEALMATWNTLSGRPADGVRNQEMLLRQVTSESTSPRIRALALRMLPTIPRQASKDGSAPTLELPQALSVARLLELVELGEDGLTLEVLRVLGGHASADARGALAKFAADAGQPAVLRAEAIAGLSSSAGEQVDGLVVLAGDHDPAVREEALRTLRGAEIGTRHADELIQIAKAHPHSADLVQAVIDRDAVARDRPEPSAIDTWLDRLNAIETPPNPAAGERIFHHSPQAMCASCHRHTGRGSIVGPDLSTIGRVSDRRWLVESLLQPNQQVAPEYRARMLVLKDGQVFTGIHLRTGGAADAETLRDHRGQERQFVRDEIEMSREISTSLMPEGLANALTDRELRDLIAFLESSR